MIITYWLSENKQTNKQTKVVCHIIINGWLSDDILNSEYEGVLGTVAGILGTLQANEVLKQILNNQQNQ